MMMMMMMTTTVMMMMTTTVMMTTIQLPQGAHPATVPGLGVEEEEEGEEFYKFKWAKLELNWDQVCGP